MLGDVDGQDAALELGGQAGGGGVLQVDATRGAPLAALLVQIVLALLLVGLLLIHADGEAALVELDVNLVARDAGKLGGDDEEVIDSVERPRAKTPCVTVIRNHASHNDHSLAKLRAP